MRSLIAFVVLSLFMHTRGFAEEISLETAESVALKCLLTTRSTEKSEETLIFNCEVITSNGNTAGYIFRASDGGFVIVTNSIELPPILSYSDTSTVAVDTSQCSLYSFAVDRLTRITKYIHDPRLAEWRSANKERWEKYLNMDVNDIVNRYSEGQELVSARWNQGYPNGSYAYNLQCPRGKCGHYTKVGCVATAMAQLAYFHKWPPNGPAGFLQHNWDGDDSNCDTVVGCDDTNGELLEAGIGDAYDWTRMTDVATYETPGADAVAELCYEIGLSVEMDYGVCESGTPFIGVGNALSDYFYYESSSTIMFRLPYSDDSWFDLLRSEFDNDRPVLYSIDTGFLVGHTLIADGWRYNSALDQMEVHFNYGWGSAASETDWHILSDIPRDINELADMAIVGIQPDYFAIGEPPPPNLLLPDDGAQSVPLAGNLVWEEVPGASGYELQISSSCGSEIIVQEETMETSYSFSPLSEATQYYWRVCAKYGQDFYGSYSGCRSFTTTEIGSGCMTTPTNLYFSVATIGGHDSEHFTVINNSGSPVTVDISVSDGEFEVDPITVDLGVDPEDRFAEIDLTYRPVDCGNDVALVWVSCADEVFDIIGSGPTEPDVCGAVTFHPDPGFEGQVVSISWMAVVGAEGYILLRDGQEIWQGTETGTTISAVAGDYAVMAYNACGESATGPEQHLDLLPPQFVPVSSPLQPVSEGYSAWGDYDGDNDLDVIVGGFYFGEGEKLKLYNNDSGLFQLVPASLHGMSGGFLFWLDHDGDGDLDLLRTGYASYYYEETHIYRNDGDDFVWEDYWVGAKWAGIGVADFDNDGDLDIAQSDPNGAPTYSVRLYENAAGVFVPLTFLDDGGYYGEICWGDFDNDADLDICVIGNAQRPEDPTGRSAILRNDNDGLFVDIDANLHPVRRGAAAWGDYDADGDLDLVISGADGEYANSLYRNENGSFQLVDVGLSPFTAASVAWGDYDNDGRIDLLIGNREETRLYHSETNIFTDLGLNILGSLRSKATWADYDNDNDLDILVVGGSHGPIYGAQLIRNDVLTPNTRPAPPTNLKAVVNGDRVTLTWDAAADMETPTLALSYNLRIGNTPGGNQICPSLADSTGYRRVVQMGNVQLNMAWWVTIQQAGQYFWSVQTIDGAYAGSPFAPEQSFDIVVSDVSDGHGVARFWLGAATPNPFNPQTMIRYSLPEPNAVTLRIYNLTGRLVDVLVESETLSAGTHSATWTGRDSQGRAMPSGTYFYRLEAGGYVETRRMTLIR